MTEWNGSVSHIRQISDLQKSPPTSTAKVGWLGGWFFAYPSEKYMTSSVGMIFYSRFEWKNNPVMFRSSPPTSLGQAPFKKMIPPRARSRHAALRAFFRRFYLRNSLDCSPSIGLVYGGLLAYHHLFFLTMTTSIKLHDRS